MTKMMMMMMMIKESASSAPGRLKPKMAPYRDTMDQQTRHTDHYHDDYVVDEDDDFDGDGDDDHGGQRNCEVCRDDTGNIIKIVLNRVLSAL